MENSRREFLKLAGMAGFGIAGASFLPVPSTDVDKGGSRRVYHAGNIKNNNNADLSIIGLYGPWANSLLERELPEFSLRREDWQDLDIWRDLARNSLKERLAIPEIGGMPEVKVNRQFTYDGLHIEELSWQLPYGRPTEALLLKPVNASKPLPGILAFYEHGLQKYFGPVKIVRTSDSMHPVIEVHYRQYYENFAWANEIAKRGYVVLVSDVFPFGNRRVKLQDLPGHMRQGLEYQDPDEPNSTEIEAYNQWAAQHEHIMAKSLFSAGTTWPGVFFGEDRKALDVLCAREEVDASRIGCGGLSGGGIRTVIMGGMDPRIKCAVCVAFMTTWKDLVIHNSYNHTWMTFIPLLPNELEFAEILGLRVPLPTLVLNAEQDPLFTLNEMKCADEILQQVYEIAGAGDRYKCTYHPGPHRFDAKMQSEAFEWFDRWLKV